MKVVYGPLVTRASGRFGGLVASNWKGIDLFRRFAKPSNPESADQVAIRNLFSNLNSMYLTQAQYTRAAWVAYAAGRAMIPRNPWIGRNVKAMQLDTNLAALVPTPGDPSTLQPTTVTFTPGAATITIACDDPPSLTGWTHVRMVGVGIQDRDPTTIFAPTLWAWTEEMDDATPFTVDLTSMPTQLHECGCFHIWTAPDGTTRYSASVTGTATPT